MAGNPERRMFQANGTVHAKAQFGKAQGIQRGWGTQQVREATDTGPRGAGHTQEELRLSPVSTARCSRHCLPSRKRARFRGLRKSRLTLATGTDVLKSQRNAQSILDRKWFMSIQVKLPRQIRNIH